MGAPSRARPAGRGRGPLGGVWGGGRRRGCPPPPFLLPATAAANHQAGARPWRGLPRSRNSQTPSFRGKKIRAAGSAAGSGSRVGAPDRRHAGAGPGARRRRERHPQPGQVRRQASGQSGRRGEQRGARDASAGRGMGNPAQPARRPCRTSRSGPGRAAGTGARVPRGGAACRRPLALPPPGECPPELQTPALASGTSRDPGGGRAGCAGGGPGEPQGRMSGSAPAREAPRDSIVAPEPDFARP